MLCIEQWDKAWNILGSIILTLTNVHEYLQRISPSDPFVSLNTLHALRYAPICIVPEAHFSVIYCDGSLFIIIHHPLASSSVNPIKTNEPPALVEHPTSSRHISSAVNAALNHQGGPPRCTTKCVAGERRPSSLWDDPKGRVAGGRQVGSNWDGPGWIYAVMLTPLGLYGYGYGYGLW